MNERIKQLLIQSGVRENWNPADWYSVSPMMLEKFAELLVAECLSVAKRQHNPHTLNYKPSERFVEDLQQHFGVK